MSKVNMTCIYGPSDFLDCCHLLRCSQDKFLTCRRTNDLTAAKLQFMFWFGLMHLLRRCGKNKETHKMLCCVNSINRSRVRVEFFFNWFKTRFRRIGQIQVFCWVYSSFQIGESHFLLANINAFSHRILGAAVSHDNVINLNV